MSLRFSFSKSGICFLLEDLLGHSEHGCSGLADSLTYSQVLKTGAVEAGCFDIVPSTRKNTLLQSSVHCSGEGQGLGGSICWGHFLVNPLFQRLLQDITYPGEIRALGRGSGLKISKHFSLLLYLCIRITFSADDLRSIWFGCIKTILVDFHL